MPTEVPAHLTLSAWETGRWYHSSEGWPRPANPYARPTYLIIERDGDTHIAEIRWGLRKDIAQRIDQRAHDRYEGINSRWDSAEQLKADCEAVGDRTNWTRVYVNRDGNDQSIIRLSLEDVVCWMDVGTPPLDWFKDDYAPDEEDDDLAP